MSKAIKETRYQRTLAQAWSGKPKHSIVLERIFVKENDQDEIRLAWWKDGQMCNRPADVDAIDWVPLFTNAVEQGVFTAEERIGMLKALLR